MSTRTTRRLLATGTAAATVTVLGFGAHASAATGDQVRPCAPGQVTATSHTSDPSAGQRHSTVTFTAVSGVSCTMAGPVSSVGFQRGGGPMKVPTRSAHAPRTPILLDAGHYAQFDTSSSNLDGPGVTPNSMTFSVANSGGDLGFQIPWHGPGLTGTVRISSIHGMIDDKTVGPYGYKGLQLGMSKQEAEQTGLITDPEKIGACTWYYLKPSEGKPNPGDGVVISPTRGVVNIPGTDVTHTPEGISMGSISDHAGSTDAQIAAVYPQRTVDPDQPFTVYDAPAPGNASAHYVLAMGDDHRVKDMSLASNDGGGCF
ncbi:MAG TPA: DUF4232 domain-containing protein [Mycobacteriales bacterium]|nr:DUF4232 domain-containing protein [Mycobacteriales bacterium]